MQTMVSKRTRAQRDSQEIDLFLESIRKMVESGSVAKTQGNLIKMQIISQVQAYSSELPFHKGAISDTFLELCDLMVNGRLSKMSPDVLKVYLVLVVRREDTSGRSSLKLRELAEKAGIEDVLAVNTALETLKEEGFIESVEDPVLGRKRSLGRKNGTQEGLFLL